MGLFLSSVLVLRTHGCTANTQVLCSAREEMCQAVWHWLQGCYWDQHCCFSRNPFSLWSLLVQNWRLLGLLRVRAMLCGQSSQQGMAAGTLHRGAWRAARKRDGAASEQCGDVPYDTEQQGSSGAVGKEKPANLPWKNTLFFPASSMASLH